ncbi:uncharacterized protein LOC131183793 isoform X2 [Hevea brasiliensis]|uniref:uncharacterized protein LOC131183793 isoform X2 n=1 Tax=Hevea brasiliensis TaxID=3981 RepID=UPI0025E3EF0D|nr:uncharacterized protein LOC131183793 isoform X2 [Hevea brasiliensis]
MSEVRVNIRAADRPRDPARWSEIAVVVSALSVPVIANGDVFDYGDFERIEVATGASSVIVARGALLNASVFSPEGKGYWEEVKGDCVKKFKFATNQESWRGKVSSVDENRLSVGGSTKKFLSLV